MYKLLYSPRACSDAKKIGRSNLKKKCQELLSTIEKDPFQNPPPYKALGGELKGYYSRRINVKHRLVYEVVEAKKTIKVICMWSHYDGL